MKKCSKCNQEKTTDCFYKNKNTKDGRQARCKECCKKHSKMYYKENKENYSAQNKKWAKENKEYNNQRNKVWMEKNKEKRKAYKKKYRKENRESIKDYKSNYENSKRKENPEYRLEVNLRKRLRRTVYKITGNPLENKSCTQASRDLLGCSINDLQTHLETSFTKGMNWGNYGQWHVDHIKPVCSFDLTDEEQVKECFHYSNLQALWAIDNVKKGGQIFPS